MNRENIKDVFSVISTSASKSIKPKNATLGLRTKSYEIILKKFIESPMNVESIPRNIHRIISNTSQTVQYKSGDKTSPNDYVLIEIPFDFYSVYLKIKLVTQQVVDYTFIKTSDMAEPLSADERQTLNVYVKAIISGDYLEYPEYPLECLLSTLFMELSLLRPISCESVSVSLKSNGIKNDKILEMNMLIRTILYKLKRCGLLVMTDDEENDNEDSISKSLDNSNISEQIINDVIQYLNEKIGTENMVKCLKETNQVVYIKDLLRNMISTTIIGEELNYNTIKETLFKYMDDYYDNQTRDLKDNAYNIENILGVVLYALRMVLFKETSEKDNPKNQEYKGEQ